MSGMIPYMEPPVATETVLKAAGSPAPAESVRLRVTFGQIEAVLKDVPVDLLPEVYEYLSSLVASTTETPNALTRQVFEDTDAGRNLNRYQTVEALFEHINAPEA